MKEISVGLPDDVLNSVVLAAQRDCRTVGGQARFYITEAVRQWPPPLPVVRKDNVSDVRAWLTGLEAERDELAAKQAKLGWRFAPGEEDRLRFLRETCKSVLSHVVTIERLMGMRA